MPRNKQATTATTRQALLAARGSFMMIASFLNIMTADQWLSNDHEPSAQQQGGANTLELSVQKKIEAATTIEQMVIDAHSKRMGPADDQSKSGMSILQDPPTDTTRPLTQTPAAKPSPLSENSLKKYIVNPSTRAFADGSKVVTQNSMVNKAKKLVKRTRSSNESIPSTEFAPNTAAESLYTTTTHYESSQTIPLTQPEATTHKARTSESTSETVTLVMTPSMEFWLHDGTIALITLVSIAMIPTWNYWSQIVKEKQVPISVTLLWMTVALFVGMELGMRRRPLRDSVEILDLQDELLGFVSEPTSLELETRQGKQSARKGYGIVTSLFGQFGKFRITSPRDKQKRLRQPWSVLSLSAKKCPKWEKIGFVKVSDPLMKWLMRNPDFTRKPLKQVIESHREHPKDDDTIDTSMKIGTFDISQYPASSLEEDVVDPCFHLRGLDCFLTDAAENDMVSHPFLLKQGLRETPTFMVNAVLHWANVLVYFELPDWFTDFDEIVENNDDPNDVKAVKRFLTGTDEYRNKRLKVMPYVVDGPLPIRVLAPPRREMSVINPLLPNPKWNFHKKETAADGRMLQPCLELELDLISNRAMRGISAMVRRHVKIVSLDLAVIISGESEKEPGACLGLWRFDYFDPNQCPQLPPRATSDEDEKSALDDDLIRASQIMELSNEEMAALVEASAE